MYSRRFVFLLLLIFDLLCVQQISLAHGIGHFGDQRRSHVLSVSVEDRTSGGGIPESFSHICSTCFALAGLDLPLFQPDFEWHAEAGEPGFRGGAGIDSVFFERFSHFQGRAPPVLLN